MLEFILNHRADDVVYALCNPEYFGLTQEQTLELHKLVFEAIDAFSTVKSLR